VTWINSTGVARMVEVSFTGLLTKFETVASASNYVHWLFNYSINGTPGHVYLSPHQMTTEQQLSSISYAVSVPAGATFMAQLEVQTKNGAGGNVQAQWLNAVTQVTAILK
jgi:hypothetical protein